jgi:hypothetical protein
LNRGEQLRESEAQQSESGLERAFSVVNGPKEQEEADRASLPGALEAAENEKEQTR